MEVRDRIIARAVSLFRRYGIRSITMDELAGQCGISKKTLYQHFEDKDSLVSTLVDGMIVHAEKGCTVMHQKAENAVQEVFLSMDMVEEMFEGVNPNMVYDLRKYHSAAYSLLEKHKTEFLYDIVKKNLRRGIEEGLYRAEIDVELMSALQLYNMEFAFNPPDHIKERYSLSTLDMELTLHFLHGIATTRGERLIEKYKQQRIKLQIV
jgi:AcrR family transcriptional regulator